MNRQLTRLKLDKAFSPSLSEPGEELFANGIFVFNISKMLAFIRAHPGEFPVETLPIAEIPPITPDGRHESAIRVADLANPIVLAEISPGNFNVIDGHHRLARTRREQLGSILAYRIHPVRHVAFLTTREAYEKYVEYWNLKVEQRRSQ